VTTPTAETGRRSRPQQAGRNHAVEHLQDGRRTRVWRPGSSTARGSGTFGTAAARGLAPSGRPPHAVWHLRDSRRSRIWRLRAAATRGSDNPGAAAARGSGTSRGVRRTRVWHLRDGRRTRVWHLRGGRRTRVERPRDGREGDTPPRAAQTHGQPDELSTLLDQRARDTPPVSPASRADLVAGRTAPPHHKRATTGLPLTDQATNTNAGRTFASDRVGLTLTPLCAARTRARTGLASGGRPQSSRPHRPRANRRDTTHVTCRAARRRVVGDFKGVTSPLPQFGNPFLTARGCIPGLVSIINALRGHRHELRHQVGIRFAGGDRHLATSRASGLSLTPKWPRPGT
jgi:hypothetical protein